MSEPDAPRAAAALHFQPWSPQLRPCWHCHHFEGLLHGGSAAACSLRPGPRVRAMPQGGCSAFEREPGADDDDAPPAVTGRAPAVPAARA